MVRLNFFILFCVFYLCGCSTTKITYNPHEFDTSNYQINVEQAVDAADVLNDFDAKNIPNANLEPADFSALVQADIFFNEGIYTSAYPLYERLALKYRDPRIIFKAITSIEHIASTDEQMKKLDSLVSLFIQVTPSSNLAKLFGIKLALADNNVALATHNLEQLMSDNKTSGRSILLFISSMITSDLDGVHASTMSDFGDYAISHYKAYPESYLLATVCYAVINNPQKVIHSLIITHQNFPNWEIPAIWSSGILKQSHHESSVVMVLNEFFKLDKSPNNVLQNTYISALILTNQLNVANKYIQLNLQLGINANDMLVNAGIIDIKLGDYNEALHKFLRVESSDNQIYDIVQLIIGGIYDYQGNESGAIEYYKRVNNVNPYVFNAANLMLLNSYAKLNDEIKVTEILNKIAAKDKLEGKAKLLFKSAYYAELGLYKSAYNLLNANYKEYRHDKTFIYEYAGMATMVGKLDLAIKLYQRYIKLAPKDAYGYNNLGFLYIDTTKNYKKGFDYAKRAFAINPEDPSVLDTIGWAYYKNGDYIKARQYIGMSLAKNYDLDTARHLKQVYLALGDYQNANKIVISDDNQVQATLKRQLLNKSADLLSLIQFGIVPK